MKINSISDLNKYLNERWERNFLRTDEVLAVPSLAFLRSWRDSPTVRSRGNNLIGLRSQPPVPRRRFILLPPCRLSFSFSPSSVGHFKPFNPPCRGSSTSNWMPPRKAWPLSWSIPLGTSNFYGSAQLIVSYRMTISVRGKRRDYSHFVAPGGKARGSVARENGAFESRLKIHTGWSRKPINKSGVCKLNRRETLSLVCKPTTEPDRLAGLRDILSHVAAISLWEWARVWNSWENLNRKRARDRRLFGSRNRVCKHVLGF